MISICKYDYYQDPKNYERTTKGTNERTNDEPMTNHPLPDNNKNNKNDKNNKKKEEEEKIKTRSLEFKKKIIDLKTSYPKPMLESFYSYWTETNKSNTKMRFELEPTFEVTKRLATWANRDTQFSHNRNNSQTTAVAPAPMVTYRGV